MNLSLEIDGFRKRVETFAPQSDLTPRILAFFSASIAISDHEIMSAVISLARRHEVTYDQLYEVVLQSYLFLGFPRMLMAADCLASVTGEERSPFSELAVSGEQAANWSGRGIELCKKVYDSNYTRLKSRVEVMAPEIFQWMIFEGYGKVLSRPELDIVSREMCIVSCLTIENMPSQLHSHMRGALNVGAPEALLRQVIDDVGVSAGDGYTTAQNILGKLGVM